MRGSWGLGRDRCYDRYVLCDLYFPSGRPVPFSTRRIYRAVLDDLARAGWDYVAGLEVECKRGTARTVLAARPKLPQNAPLVGHGQGG